MQNTTQQQVYESALGLAREFRDAALPVEAAREGLEYLTDYVGWAVAPPAVAEPARRFAIRRALREVYAL